jgi:serine/threonine protein kinase
MTASERTGGFQVLLTAPNVRGTSARRALALVPSSSHANPWDPRFAREAQLLSRIHDPSVPRLFDLGVRRLASGAMPPSLVMQWIEGVPLYEWGSEYAPSPGQLLLLVAQLARALATTHAAHAAHRDVKGDNIRVRHSDERAVLMDFGSGHFQGAARLTWGSLLRGHRGR